MSYQSPYQAFIFESYSYDEATHTARFNYSFDGQRHFSETAVFDEHSQVGQNSAVLESALKLAFYVAGTSYYKAFPTKKVIFKSAQPDSWQAEFLQKVYTEGLSQFLFENKLTLEDVAVFAANGVHHTAASYQGGGTVALQSGGKDSLLLAALLREKRRDFTPLYITSAQAHPRVLDTLSKPLRTIHRHIDRDGLMQAKADGGMNGHVPVTYIVEAYALIDAILHGQNMVLAAIGQEGEEPHEYIGQMPVNHQWSKTWQAEQLLSEYLQAYVSADMQIGSPLRGFSELKIAELFMEYAWEQFGHTFSSCNQANYRQGKDNSQLQWCGQCPKCANSYLLFAPFIEPEQLRTLFGGQDLFAKLGLTETFKGLLGIDGVMKPFECVGETGELRTAYHMAQRRSSEYQLSFEVPESSFDYQKLGRSQPWAYELIR